MYRNILIIGNKLLGDAIDSLHAVASLVKKNPQADYDFIGYQYSAFLYQHLIPFKKSFYLDQKKTGLSSTWCSILGHTKFKTDYDLVFIIPGGWGWALFSFFLKVRTRVGHGSDFRSIFLTEKKKINSLQPNYKNFDDLFRLLYPNGSIQRATLPVKSFLMSDFGIKSPFVVLSVMASEEKKIWGEENFIALARRIKSFFKAEIVLIGTESERVAVDRVAEHGEVKGINLAGRLKLEEVFHLIEHCLFFLGNDSGLTHAAALLGKINFAVLGPTNPTLSFPFSFGHHTHFIFQDDKSVAHHLRKRKKFAMNKIKVDQVWKRITAHVTN